MVENKKVDADVSTDDVDDIDDSDESKNTAEYVKKLKAEAKSYRQDKAAIKKERDEIKAKLEAIETEKLTEAEKDKKHIAELEKKLADNEESIKSKEIDTLIVEAISDKNIIDKPTAKLLIKNELAGEEEITDKVVNDVVDKLLKDKPFLVKSDVVNPSDLNFKKTETDISKDPDAMMSEFLHS